jgi:preprotein translocase subunit SecE
VESPSGKSGSESGKTTSPAVPPKEVAKKQAVFQSKAVTKARSEPGKIKAFVDRGLQFLREVKTELKKVTWPTRKQTIGSTLVVIILVMIISIFLGVVDIGLSNLVRVVLQ